MRGAWLLTLGLSACVGTVADEPLSVSPLSLQPTAAALQLSSDGAGFGDQRGGGVFVSDDGKAVRLRGDGSMAALESHPDNSAPPGKVQRVLAMGSDCAWVVADNGVYVARAGWLYELRAGIDVAADDVIAAAVSGDEEAFVALRQGLYRVSGDDFAELKRGDESITNITALAVAPAPSGGPGLWFVQNGSLHYAEQTASTRYAIGDAGLPAAATSDMIALAGVSAAPDAPGELWLLTPKGLWQHTPARGFRAFELPAHSAGTALVSAGRFVWLQAGGALYRYDADHQHWGQLSEPPIAPQLLAADALGSLWLRSDAGSALLAEPGVPRVQGLFEGSRVYAPDVALTVSTPADDAPDSVTFALDDGEHVECAAADARSDDDSGELVFSLAGFDSSGNVQTYSFAGLSAGMHTLTLSARRDAGSSTRALHFDMRDVTSQKLSWATDVQPIYAARCAKCHAGMGPGHLLNSYELWSAQASAISAAVSEKRMPADGPLDPSQIQLITRWAAAGGAP